MVGLEQNIGLGHALDAGLASCAHEVVARMDADDVSLPERFATQIPLLAEGYDLVGSALLEFADDEDDIVGLRTPPLGEDEIRSWSRFHDPFNHPTVVYRRSDGAVSRRVPRPSAHGGLLAVRPHDRRRRESEERQRTLGEIPGRRWCVRQAGRLAATAQ